MGKICLIDPVYSIAIIMTKILIAKFAVGINRITKEKDEFTFFLIGHWLYNIFPGIKLSCPDRIGKSFLQVFI